MKTKILFIILILISSIVFNACEDKLDVGQPGTTAVEDFYLTDTDAEEAIAAVYVQLRSMWLDWFWLNVNLSDDVYGGGGGRGDNAFIERLNEFTFTPANSFVQSSFSNLYVVVYRCNMIIDNIEPTTDVQKRAVAEAKVARAWANFFLTTLWGTPPLVLHELNPDEYKQPNSTQEAFWAQIEKDLNEAIGSNVLVEKSGVNDQATGGGKMTKQFAQAMLGKAYLWQEKYAEAAAQFDAVANSGKYALIDDFENLWRAPQDMGSERIFEVVHTNDADNTNQGAVIINNLLGWRTDHMNVVGYFLGFHDIHFLGWGFASPTKDVYDAFVEMEGEDGYRLKSSIYTYDDVLNICTVPGFEITVGGQGLYGHEGYFPWKHRILGSEEIAGSAVFWHSNMIYMRLGEVLLLAAEAHLNSGNEAKALEYINQIRVRAHLEPLASVTMEDIKKEKRLELWSEGVRYLDLQRWGDAANAMAEKGARIPTFYGFNEDGTRDVKWLHTNPSGSYGYKTGKHEWLPFPEHETLVNPNIVQNPGW